MKYIAHCMDHEIPLNHDGTCPKCFDGNGRPFVLDMQSYFLVPEGVSLPVTGGKRQEQSMLILRDKFGWPVEIFTGRPILNFFRRIWYTDLAQTIHHWRQQNVEHHIWCKSLLKMDLDCNCGRARQKRVKL